MSKPSIEEIYSKYGPKVMAYISSHVANRADVEDLHSAVFAKIVEKYDTYDPSKAAVSTWIYRITGNTVIDHYRVSHPGEELPEDIPDETDLADDMIRAESLSELAGALKKLSSKDRDIIILHYYRGMKLQEVAEAMGISYSGCRMRHKTALLELRKLMETA